MFELVLKYYRFYVPQADKLVSLFPSPTYAYTNGYIGDVSVIERLDWVFSHLLIVLLTRML